MGEIKKIDLESEDFVDDRLEQMRELFPEVFSESGIDFDKLRLELGDEVDEGQERYAFTWPGKADAIRLSQTTSTATLRPNLEKSRGRTGEDGSFDSDNIYIEGDNLEVLKLLQRAYHGKVKLIYIDPPYNTGHDFVYPDTFGDTIVNYKQQTGLAGQSNADTSGRYHSAWCSMMYPRLKLARELLSENGFIFISIDSHECPDLRKICDEVFGEENLRNVIAVRRGIKNVQAQFDDVQSLAQGHEYILLYSRTVDARMPKLYLAHDGKPGKWDTFWRGTDRPTMRYELFGQTPSSGQWRWAKDRAEEAVENYKEFLKTSSVNSITLDEYYLNHYAATNEKLNFVRLNNDGVVQYYVPPSNGKLLSDNWMDLTLAGNETKYFDTEKNPALIERMISWITEDNDLIVDFFSGSGTTAHSAMLASCFDGKARRVILVQLPEEIKDNKDAREDGYSTICDIARERIQQSGSTISRLTDESNRQLKLGEEPKELPDIGFRVFELDESGIQKPEEGQLLVDRVKPGRSDLDIIFEMMLKWGLELTYPVEQEEVNGYPVYSVACDELICCMKPGLTVDTLEAIAERQPRRVFLLDSVIDDSIKLNALQIFKRVEERTQQKIDLRTV